MIVSRLIRTDGNGTSPTRHWSTRSGARLSSPRYHASDALDVGADEDEVVEGRGRARRSCGRVCPLAASARPVRAGCA